MPASWISDSMDMKWGPIDLGKVQEITRIPDDMAWFTGGRGTNLIGLGGSQRHLIGQATSEDNKLTRFGSSMLGQYVGMLSFFWKTFME
jgi:hypothetical protein